MIEMFINDTMSFFLKVDTQGIEEMLKYIKICLLYTSDAADEL